MIKQALNYVNKWGFSIIPLLPNKKPLIRWEDYQSRYATEKEIIHWWRKYPDSMIGIVTGKLSNIAVVDIDTKNVPNALAQYSKTPTVDTLRGFHWYFRYVDGVTNAVNVMEDVDVRGEGGYVVAPPSITEEGKEYKWLTPLDVGLPKFPIEIMPNPEARFEKPKTQILSSEETFIEGRRDEDLFHVAHCLIKGGMQSNEANNVVMRLASTCVPPFPGNEARIKVESAVNRAIRKERPWIVEVKEWVAVTKGWFSVTSCYNELQAVTMEDKGTVRQNLIRLRDARQIEPDPKRNGFYRRIELECEEIDWRNAPTDDMPVKFPLDIHDLVNIYPSNIIIVAGESNAGKTAFLLNFIKLNMANYTIHYFNSEMGASELKIRLGLFKDVDEWRFKAWERSDNFIDVIKPDDINVIDFLDVTDEFWKVGSVIKGIHEKLKGGLAIIGLQKNEGRYDIKTGKWVDRDLGRGGALSIEKPRLYLSMGHGRIKVTKAKNWKGNKNPNGLVREFKLYSGSEFVPISDWDRPDINPTVDKQGRFMV